MKAFRLIFTFLLFTFLSFSLSAQHYTPLQASELNLSETQTEQLQAIQKEYAQKRKENMESLKKMKQENGDVENFYKNFHQLREDELTAQKKILTPEQLTQFEGYVLEKETEKQSNKLTWQIQSFDSKYPGMDLTEEQHISILEKKQSLTKEGWGNRYGDVNYQGALKKIYREVMDDRQFALYETIEHEKKVAKEEKILTELKKAIPVAEESIPVFEDFTLPRFKTLRNKLETQISDADKLVIEELRAERKESFQKVMNEFLEKDLDFLEIENTELARYVELTKEMVEDQADLIAHAWTDEWASIFSGEPSRLQQLTQKYKKQIDAMEEELLWTAKETAKKVAEIASKEYPMPPMSVVLAGVTEFPEEARFLFLLLDPEVGFELELPNYEAGEGKHFASVFPNPAVKNQTLNFFLQQDEQVTIEILDEAGRLVKTLRSENMPRGNQQIQVNTDDLNPQLYFYRISTLTDVTLLKFTVVR